VAWIKFDHKLFPCQIAANLVQKRFRATTSSLKNKYVCNA
jgi:hypothetical protein